jgi:hypothetical protein
MAAPSSILTGTNIFKSGEFSSSVVTDVINGSWNGAGSAVSTTNSNIFLYAPVALKILGWVVFCDVSATLTIDIWQTLLASAPPTVSNTITNSNLPGITAGTQNSLIIEQGGVLGFASALKVSGDYIIPAGSSIVLNLASNNNAKYIGFQLLCRSGS